MTTSLDSVIKKMAIVFLIIIGLYFAQKFLIPFCISSILATVFLPFCNWMEKNKFQNLLAVFISFLCLLSIVFILASLVGFQISELISDAELLKQKISESAKIFQQYIFDTLNISVKEQNNILKNEQPSYSNMAQSMLGSMTGFFSDTILMFVYFILLLYYRRHIKSFLVHLANKSQQTEMAQVIEKVAAVSQQYFIGLSKMIFLLWIMYGIGFSALGVKNAIFFAILCGVLEIVPFVGNLIGTTLTVLIAAINGADTEVLIGIIIVYMVVQFIQGWILEPLIVGSQVKINSLFTILALVLGELLWGIAGIILAIPLTAMFKIICDHFEPMKPYGFLIGEIASARKKSKIVEKL